MQIFKEKNKRLLENIFSLQILTLASYFFPLITIPFLIKSIGEYNFGNVLFAQSLSGIFGLVVAYGFDLTATKKVAIIRDNLEKLNQYFFIITYTRLLLFILLFVPFYLVITTFPTFKTSLELHLLTYLTVAEFVVLPRWFFQGVEKLKIYTILFFISKLISTVCIILIISEPKDYLLVPIILFGSVCISGVFVFFHIYSKFNFKFKRPSFNQILLNLKEGFRIFSTSLSVGIFLNANTFFLGIFQSKEIVAQYGIAEKITRVIQSLIKPIGEALYPKIANENEKRSKQDSILIIKKIIYKFSILLFVVLTASYFLRNIPITIIYKGNNYEYVSQLLVILLVGCFFGPLNFIIGNVGLMNLGKNKFYSYCVFASLLLCILLNLTLIPKFSGIGAAISYVSVEIFLTIIMVNKLQKMKN